jgi:hypothetical protein
MIDMFYKYSIQLVDFIYVIIEKPYHFFIVTLVAKLTPSIKPYSLNGLLSVENQSKNKVGFRGVNLATKVE